MTDQDRAQKLAERICRQDAPPEVVVNSNVEALYQWAAALIQAELDAVRQEERERVIRLLPCDYKWAKGDSGEYHSPDCRACWAAAAIRGKEKA